MRAELHADRGTAAASEEFFRSPAFLGAEGVTHTLQAGPANLPVIVREVPGSGGLADLRYEVMYLLEAPDAAIGAFKEVWAGIGDSIVVVVGDGLFNCHIHTDDIGASIEAQPAT